MTAPQGVCVGDGSGIWLFQREYDDTPGAPSVKIAGRLSDAYYWSVGWRLLLVLGALSVLFGVHVEQVLGRRCSGGEAQCSLRCSRKSRG